MIKKEVMIKISASQTDEYGETERIELITPGQFYKKDDFYYIIYSETELSGMEGTTTTIKAGPKKVILNRMGSSEQKQVFEKGVLNSSLFITPYGTMQVGVIPSRVEVDLTDNGGSINLEYELQIADEKASYNELQITVEQK